MNLLKNIKYFGAVIIGNIVLACGVYLFVLPSGLISGGASGISLFVNRMFGVNISLTSLVINFFMFFVGLFVMGKRFALTTVISTIANPVALFALEQIFGDKVITDDLFLCTFVGGCLVGLGIGLVIRVGASTGGMDIPPIVLNKITKIPISTFLWMFDVIIISFQIFFSKADHVLYGFAMICVYTVVVDRVMTLGKKRMELTIISEKNEEIREAILTEVDRGLTVFHGQTGYMCKETDVIITVISSRELAKTENVITRIDKDAFVIINHVSAVNGRGFSDNRIFVPRSEIEKTK